MPILEFIQLGEYVRVSAVDEETGIEAVSILPTNLSRGDMEKVAMQKLRYVIKKKKNKNNSNGGFVV